jgi:hypothetical protein
MRELSVLVLCVIVSTTGHGQAAAPPTRSVAAQDSLPFPVLFVVRRPYAYEHHNTETMYQTTEPACAKYPGGGGGLKVLNPTSGKVSTLLDARPDGMIRDPEVDYDGRSIVFSWRRGKADNFHIYRMALTVAADGAVTAEKPVQLTFASDAFDIDPVFLPDGDIVFTSSRDPKYCGCNRHIQGSLYRMRGDGANIHCIGGSTLFEARTTVMPDGRLLYDRWEYVDRDFGSAQALWVSRPDGTAHDLLYGNHTGTPIVDGRAIPGTSLIAAIFAPCHGPASGALAILDPSRGREGKEVIARLYPADAMALVGGMDAMNKVREEFENPFPIDGERMLVSRVVGPGPRGRDPGGKHKGIYLVNWRTGEQALLHSESPGCYNPIPLALRPRPITLPSTLDPAGVRDGTGEVLVLDVAQSPYMKGVQREEMRFVRVVEAPPKRNWTTPAWEGQGQHAPGMNWHDFGNKRILGTVPIQPDGSARLTVPAQKFVFFQVLDDRGRMIQSMRSGTLLQPGERLTCVGCHESTTAAVPGLSRRQATHQPPEVLTGWRGQTREFSFRRDVQPVFDRHCVSCHDFVKPEAQKSQLILAGDRGGIFNQSYIQLQMKRGKPITQLIGAAGPGPRPARSWGSYPSVLTKVLLGEHTKHPPTRITPDDAERVITWMDLNGPYYPLYETAFPNNRWGRSPLTESEWRVLTELTGEPANPWLFSLDRPGLSPALAKFDDPAQREKLAAMLREDRRVATFKQADRNWNVEGDVIAQAKALALATLKKGQDALAATPDCDADGFRPSPADQQRLDRAEHRAAIDQAFRLARSAGLRLSEQPDGTYRLATPREPGGRILHPENGPALLTAVKALAQQSDPPPTAP